MGPKKEPVIPRTLIFTKKKAYLVDEDYSQWEGVQEESRRSILNFNRSTSQKPQYKTKQIENLKDLAELKGDPAKSRHFSIAFQTRSTLFGGGGSWREWNFTMECVSIFIFLVVFLENCFNFRGATSTAGGENELFNKLQDQYKRIVQKKKPL